MATDFVYQAGFGNHFSTEAEPGALPKVLNNPQRAPLGLYAEQLSGTSFLAPRGENQRSWLYRILPSVKHSRYERLDHDGIAFAPIQDLSPTPEQLRWDPLPVPDAKTDFVDGLKTICANGDLRAQAGTAIHLYAANASMDDAFINHDGDFLIVPQLGGLAVQTEFGWLDVDPGSIAVVQRGIKFRVRLKQKQARGYICENYGAHFTLPYRGPIGANGLANERDFETPLACYEDNHAPVRLRSKFCGQIWQTELAATPFDVVAWHGNYAPFRYDLAKFNTMNTVSFDHPDPSIFTVLTSPSAVAGTSNLDFVIFPPRWMVAKDTFRPPYYHRNVMSEYMGLIHGVYDAKPTDSGFVPGSGSLHNCMTAHGPDAGAFEAASAASLKPEYQDNTLAFMFESNLVYVPTSFAMTGGLLQDDYLDCWKPLKRHFKA